jgi:cation:H+ antiporter
MPYRGKIVKKVKNPSMEISVILWLEFCVCAGLIFYSGTKLAKYGDIIAEKTGLGRTWVGVVIMASVTSLPELATGISSVTYADVPDIAVGDVLGSCVFNLLILALLDLIRREAPVKAKAHHGHMLAAGFSILLLAMAGTWISVGKPFLSFGWIGFYSLIFIVVYLAGMRVVYAYEKRQLARFIGGIAEELRYEAVTTRDAIIGYTVNALVVIMAAIFLPGIGEGLAKTTGLGQTFVGSFFIAVSTSLPEVVVSVAAVKIGAIDLAVGNLLGSNFFNIFVLAVDDFFYVKGPLLSYVNRYNAISAFSAIAMTSLVCIGITYRSEKKPILVAWDSAGILILFIANLMLLYMFR